MSSFLDKKKIHCYLLKPVLSALLAVASLGAVTAVQAAAVDDDFGAIFNTADYTTPSVLANDGAGATLGYNATDLAKFNKRYANGTNLTLNADGTITVKAGAPAGTYYIEYPSTVGGVTTTAVATITVYNAETQSQNSDGDAIADVLDLDKDNDGILDTEEGCIIMGVLPDVSGEHNSGNDYLNNYNSINLTNPGIHSNGWHPTSATHSRGVQFEDASGNVAGAVLAGTVNGNDNGTPISVEYAITKEADHSGYAYTRYVRNNTHKIQFSFQSKLDSDNASGLNPDPDVIHFKINTSNVTAGYQSRVTLRQSFNVSKFNNEAADWTFTWDGGGQATYYDDAIVAGQAFYTDAGNPGGSPFDLAFDITQREIQGTATSGSFSTNGGFRSFYTSNKNTRWRVVFPAGATNIVAKKVVLGDTTTGDTTGIGPLYPLLGKNYDVFNTTYHNQESFKEFLNYQIDFIKDTDGDGIPNCLDTDSDNDGCPDAREGAADITPTNTPTGLQSGNTIANSNLNITSLSSEVNADGVPTIAGSPQLIGQSQDVTKNDCTDTDGDGVPNWQDLDNDNDGITDAMECNANAEVITWSGAPATSTTGQTITGTLHGMTITLTDTSASTSPRSYAALPSYPGNTGINSTGQMFYNSGQYLWPADSAAGATYTFAFNAPTTQPLYFYITALDKYSKVTFANGIIEQSHNATGVGTNVLTALSTSPQDGSGATIRIPMGVTSFSYTRENLFSTGGDAYFFAMSSTCGDTDGDGIPNYLDLDSDNDGCSDAQEGGANLTTFVTASGTLTDGNGDVVTQNLGNNVNTTSTSPSYGVPTVAGTGQTVGGSQTAAQMTITTPLVSDQSVTVGDNVTFDVTSTAYQTTTFNSGSPDYSAQTPATGITYQWYKSTDNGNTWTAVAGSTGTAEDLAFPSVAYSDAGQYKREMTCDQNSCAVETAVVTLTINRPPVATPDTQLVSENTPANGTLLDNDTDADGDRLTVTHITIPGVNGGTPIAVPANGSVTQSISGVGTITVHSDGTYTFVPQANYTGTIPVIGYTVSDGNGGTASSTLTLTMSPTNDAPIADNANVNTTAGTAVSVPLNGVDAEDPSSALTYTIASVPPASQATLTYTDSNGVVQTLTAGTTLTAAEAASVQVTPVSGYTGPIDNLTYTVTDTEGAVSPTATVTFNGTDVNDPPIADNDTVTAIENTPIGIPLNGADVDGTVTTYTITQIPQASEGTLTYTDANGVTQTVSVGTTLTPDEAATLTFTPAPNYTGTVTPVQFTVTDDDNAVSNTATVTISSIVSANTAPTADSANVNTTAGTAVSVPLNGVDAEDPSSALTYTVTSVPPASQATLTYTDSNGVVQTLTASTTLTAAEAASVQITPASGYTGSIDNLTYTVTDTKGAVSPVATVTFNGTDVNDPPIAHHGAIAPVEDTPINVPLNGSDVDGTVTGVMITATMPSNQGTLMYDDDGDPSTPAVPVPLNTELTSAQAATVQFVPAPNYSGPVTDVVFTVKDDDNLWSNPAVVTIANIVDVNDPPTADNNNVTPNGNNPVSVPLNGSDVDGTISSVTVTQVPPTSQGTVTYTDSNGVTQTLTPNTTLTPSEAATVRFTPNPNHSGTVMPIIFTVTDNNGAVSQPAMIRFAPSAMPVTVFSLWSGLLMMWLLTAQALLFIRRRKR